MMQSTHSRFCHDLSLLMTARFHDATGRGFLVQANVSSVCMVVSEIVTGKAPQVKLVQRNGMIEKLSADAADKSFGDSVLPRAPNRCEPGSLPSRLGHLEARY